ncbi:hypothetical protein SB775_25690 [Peribacillus sp. SIMBA_075]|uniref:TrlF family AAA-like ATPase n=1 Tax=Peribacillus sp. SIMBA_075 TaxID=3085813 RepID=UPI00397B8FD9
MQNSYAEFIKCALQVNPYNYIKYRGKVHSMSEKEYNDEILKICREQGIQVIGLADHGNIHSGEQLRTLLSDNGIVVFPGFEISTAEKIHIVCLFPENTTSRNLERYLGKLDLIDEEDGVAPSRLSCRDIGRIVVDDLNGFWYAAHISSDNGILKMGQMQHVWKSEHFKAAQIPSSREHLEFSYKNIIENKDPNYFRNQPIGLINAKDVSQPSDLTLLEASCLIKMSEINFNCFTQAFNDPESRVKLATEMNENHHSVIERVQVFGGYLDGFDVRFSQHLNTFIGGRGTGKSTLLELIRYALEIEPKSPSSKKISTKLIEYNLGIANGRIELTISSNREHGKVYKIIKRYGNPLVITDMDDIVSNLKLEDILPAIEIIGQNEIIELIEDEESKIQILDRFLSKKETIINEQDQILRDLKRNREGMITIKEVIDDLGQQVQQLPGLEEKIRALDELGIREKLKNVDIISQEKEFFRLLNSDLEQRKSDFPILKVHSLDEEYGHFLHKELFDEIKVVVSEVNGEISTLNKSYEKIINEAKVNTSKIQNRWEENKEEIEKDIHKSIREIPDIHGKSGKDIAEEYKRISSNIARIKPLSKQKGQKTEEYKKLKDERLILLEKLRKNKDGVEDELRGTIKKVNKGPLKGKLRINLQPRKNRSNLIRFLANFQGLGEKTLEWINEAVDLSIPALCEDLDKGSSNLFEKYKEFGLSQAKADILARMTIEHRLQLEEIQLLDVIDIQLNVTPKGEAYKSLEKLSKGQQCTAILNILLLDNKDPLIIDQPEDNLDNAFIANNIVSELRKHKMNRQFIFSTHNANIPVFGDAELIAVMHEEDGQGMIKGGFIGSVDSERVKQSVIQTLEGGDSAFRMRRAKYNL